LKTNKIIIISSFFVTIITFSVYLFCSVNIIQNISLAIFGSSLIAFILSFISYNNEKNSMIYKVIIDNYIILNNISDYFYKATCTTEKSSVFIELINKNDNMILALSSNFFSFIISKNSFDKLLNKNAELIANYYTNIKSKYYFMNNITNIATGMNPLISIENGLSYSQAVKISLGNIDEELNDFRRELSIVNSKLEKKIGLSYDKYSYHVNVEQGIKKQLERLSTNVEEVLSRNK
jgi:hypothetical protein